MGLHLIHKATPSLLQRAERCLAEGDCIILMHSNNQQLGNWAASLPASITLHALDSHDALHINMDTFVALTAQHSPIVSWF